ncbi:MAG TPA: glucose 1-dehydrogenase [Solirubrobacterales bacterium]|jgi:NAD(P)-dependent dehydrogenase (short-subunit alcohol dehydrogenase family)
MDLGIDGRVAIVTGASRGLGFAAVKALVAEGVKVIAAARSEGNLPQLEQSHPGQVVRQAYDARDPEAGERLVAATLETFGDLDILVNNAGIAPAARFAEDEMATWRDVLEVNVMAPVALTQAAGAHMIEREDGKVINIASLTGLRGKAWLSAYSASKGALVRFTEAVAAEWARYNIQVNAIAPGAFRTEAQHEVTDSEELYRKRVARIPARRFAEPSEMDALLCFLASPASDFVTGAVYPIDGGELARL